MPNSEVNLIQPTGRLAEFIAGFDAGKLSEYARATVKMGILDSAGVALAGSVSPAGRIVARFARDQGNGPSSVWGHRATAPVTLAVLANGTAAHALDYDDVNWALTGHPSVSLTPAVLGLGELHGRTGEDVISAYACGFEIMAKIGRTCMPEHSLTGGWHATSTIGTIGATAACARILGLNETQIVNALGVAVSEASGVVQNFGTMTKPLHGGLAAVNGIQAAGLALMGFTASPDAMEGKHGFYGSHSRDLPLTVDYLADLGQSFELDASGLVIKPYPCGVAGHPMIDAALVLREQLSKEEIKTLERIEVGATSYTLDKMRYLSPRTELEAKFSLTYQVARTLLDGKPVLAHFQPDAIADPAVRALAEKVTLFQDEEIEKEWRSNGGCRPCRVILTLADGRILTHLVRISKGNPEAPMTRSELHSKFMDCASAALGKDRASEAAAMLEKLEDVENVADVGRVLRG